MRTVELELEIEARAGDGGFTDLTGWCGGSAPFSFDDLVVGLRVEASRAAAACCDDFSDVFGAALAWVAEAAFFAVAFLAPGRLGAFAVLSTLGADLAAGFLAAAFAGGAADLAAAGFAVADLMLADLTLAGWAAADCAADDRPANCLLVAFVVLGMVLIMLTAASGGRPPKSVWAARRILTRFY